MATKKTVRAAAHESRETELREAEAVHETQIDDWKRGSSLEMPPARPGMDQRWIRVSMNGRDDATNWARKQREGWHPRDAATVSKNFPVPRIEQGKFAGFIGIEGSVLCERPLRISQQRDRYFRQLNERRTASTNADLERVNQANANPAFGPIRMASKTTPAREVNVQTDMEE
mgnify:CR=1 FL=1